MMRKSVNTEVVSNFAKSLLGLFHRKLRRPMDPLMSPAKCVSLRLMKMSGR